MSAETTRMDSKIPQLRVILNTNCGKKCIYCRPSGEAAELPRAREFNLAEMIDWITLLMEAGITDIRLTGGDPAMCRAPDLIALVNLISARGAAKVSLVTRNGRIGAVLAELKEAGLRQLVFSLDSTDPGRWCRICGIPVSRQGELADLIATIDQAIALGFEVRVNCVPVKGSAETQIRELLTFVRTRSIPLKIEELIRELNVDGESLHVDLAPFYRQLALDSKCESELIPAGGVGHPMPVIQLNDGARIIWKLFAGGAYYGPGCRDCRDFPCDDALMALRLTADGRLETCLRRSEMHYDLGGTLRDHGKRDAMDLIDRALSQFKQARKYAAQEIAVLRRDQKKQPGMDDAGYEEK